MPRKLKLDPRGCRSRRFWPSLSDESQELILNYLGFWRAKAEQAAFASAALADIANRDDSTLNNAKWWMYSVRTIDWLMHHVHNKQEWLEVLLAQKEGRWKPPVREPDTLSELKPSGSSSANGTSAEEDPPAGTVPAKRSAKRSRPRAPRAGKP